MSTFVIVILQLLACSRRVQGYQPPFTGNGGSFEVDINALGGYNYTVQMSGWNNNVRLEDVSVPNPTIVTDAPIR